MHAIRPLKINFSLFSRPNTQMTTEHNKHRLPETIGFGPLIIYILLAVVDQAVILLKSITPLGSAELGE